MVEANVAAMKRWFEEVWNQRRMETIYELVAPDCVIQGVSEIGETLQGPGAFVLVYQRLVARFRTFASRWRIVSAQETGSWLGGRLACGTPVTAWGCSQRAHRCN